MSLIEDCRRHPVVSLMSLMGLILAVVSVIGGGIWIGTTSTQTQRNLDDIAALKVAVTGLNIERAASVEREKQIIRDLGEIKVTIRDINRKLGAPF